MKRLNGILEQCLHGLTALASMGFFAIVLASILLRKAGYSIETSIELSRLSFVWACFLAAAITYRRRGHVGLTVLHARLPQVWRWRCTRLLHGIILLFMLMVLGQSIHVVVKLWPTRLPMLGISQAWLYLPLPVSSVFMVFFTLEFLAPGSGATPEGSAPG